MYNPILPRLLKILFAMLVGLSGVFFTRAVILWLIAYYPNKWLLATILGLVTVGSIWFLKDQLGKLMQEKEG